MAFPLTRAAEPKTHSEPSQALSGASLRSAESRVRVHVHGYGRSGPIRRLRAAPYEPPRPGPFGLKPTYPNGVPWVGVVGPKCP
jgi:hypothetical protein